MIPTIGVMIGAYIITRMAELFATRGWRDGISWLGALTGLVAAVSIADLVQTSTPPDPPVAVEQAVAPYFSARTGEMVYP